MTGLALAEIASAIAALAAIVASVESSAGATPAVQAGSIGSTVVYSPVTGGLRLSLDSASITIAAALGDSLPRVEVTVGRQLLKWGPGATGSLVLSGHAPLDALALEADLGRFKYVQVHAARDAAAGRWLLAHRLEGQIAPGVVAGISETAACVHRPKSIMRSGPNRSVIPAEADYQFRRKAITDSGAMAITFGKLVGIGDRLCPE